jgi:hypothetical protein
MSSDDDEGHALNPFLAERLLTLGLDSETYGAYILPLLTDEDEQDEDEWASVMELLQASSESHSDDVQAWLTLRLDINVAWKAHRDQVKLREKHEHDLREHQFGIQIEREREIAREAAAKQAQQKALEAKESTDDAKRALLDRFAYEDGDGGDDEDDETPMTNHDVAKQREEEKSKEVRSHKQTTKKEEQHKTKEAKINKVQLKEERRKRATKGERKR